MVNDMPESDSQDAWDEICVNPHQSEIDAGRREGREAGGQAGFNHGFVLGRTKGIEFGMELGFIWGFLNTVEAKIQSSEDDAAKNEKLHKKLEDLRRAVDDFPSPNTMFENTKNEEDVQNERDDSEDIAMPGGTDIFGYMQRIRAKFKVLTAQLKISHHSLKQVMAGANRKGNGVGASNERDTDEPQVMSSEW